MMDTKKSRWLVGGIILAILGCIVSFYSTLHHVEVKNLGFSDAFCNVNSTINCDDIAKSPYSEVFGIPLGVYGFGYFLGLLFLCAITLWKREEAYKDGIVTYKVLVGLGVISSLILAAISWFKVGALCLTCVSIYVICFLQAIWLRLHKNSVGEPLQIKPLINGGINAAIALLIPIILYNFTLGAGSPPTKDRSTSTQTSKKHDFPVNTSPYQGLGEDYRKGSDQAAAVIVEFADFECPGCQSMSRVLQRLHDEYGDKILIVFKNNPLDQSCNPNIKRLFHKHACTAAILARCAGIQGKFWAFHDAVFANQSNIGTAMLRQTAKNVGLSDNDIDTCLSSEDIVAKIREDIQLADHVQAPGTPSIYLNGVLIQEDRTLDHLKQQIDRILNR